MIDFKSTINFKAADRAVGAALRDGLGDASERLLAASNALVPVESGALRDSGRVDVDPLTLQAAVSYTADYAAIVHERMDLAHDDGQAKFLESALASERGEVAAALAARVRARL